MSDRRMGVELGFIHQVTEPYRDERDHIESEKSVVQHTSKPEQPEVQTKREIRWSERVNPDFEDNLVASLAQKGLPYKSEKGIHWNFIRYRLFRKYFEEGSFYLDSNQDLHFDKQIFLTVSKKSALNVRMDNHTETVGIYKQLGLLVDLQAQSSNSNEGISPVFDPVGSNGLLKISDLNESGFESFSTGHFITVDGEKLSLYNIYTLEKCREVGIQYNKNQSEMWNLSRAKFFKELFERGIIRHDTTSIIVENTEEFRKYINEFFNRPSVSSRVSGRLKFKNATEIFKDINFYTSDDLNLNQEELVTMSPRTAFPLPTSLHDLYNLEGSNGFTTRYKDAVAKLEDFSDRVVSNWGEEIKLEDGNITNLAEIIIFQKLFGQLKARRNERGELEMLDNNGQHTPFTAQKFVTQTRLNIATSGDSLRYSPYKFFKRYLKNLDGSYLFNTDFKVTYGTEAYQMKTPEPERLAVKGTARAEYRLGSDIRIGGKLYVGKGSEIFGVKKENIYTLQLDDSTIGIFENTDGNFRIFATEKLPPKDFQLQYYEKLKKRGYANLGKFSGHFNFGHKQGSFPVPYDIKNFLPQRADEDAESYKIRLQRNANTGEILKQFNQYCKEFGIAINNLKWFEKLIIVNFLNETNVSKERINNLVSQYGIDGLRVLVIGDYDPYYVNEILSLTEEKDNTAVESLIRNVSGILSSINDFQEKQERFMATHWNNAEESAKLPFYIKDAITRRIKDVILACRIPESSKDFTVKECSQALKGMHIFLQILEDLHAQKSFKITEAFKDEQTKILLCNDLKSKAKYRLKLTNRPHAKHNAQARFNFTLEFVSGTEESVGDVYKQEIRHGDTSTNPRNMLRVGLDLDTYYTPPRVSLDVGSSPVLTSTTLYRSGDVLGRALSAVDENGSHTTNPFTSYLADPEVFAKLVKSLKDWSW